MSITLDQLLALPLEERNVLFHSLTKEERAILVAQDVLLRIKEKEYIPTANTYVGTTDEFDALPDGPLQPVLGTTTCTVCAIGATFLSTVRLGNNASLGTVRSVKSYSTGGQLIEVATAAFSEAELRAMEAVVENHDEFLCFTRDTVQALARYRKKLVGKFDGGNEKVAKPIIRALMNNVLKNGGVLKIPGYVVDLDKDRALALSDWRTKYESGPYSY